MTLFAWSLRTSRGLALVQMKTGGLEATEVDVDELRVCHPDGASSFPETVSRVCCQLARVVIGVDGQRVSRDAAIRQFWTATA